MTDLGLTVRIWPANTTMDATLEHFPPDAWEQAIDYARQASRSDGIRDVEVVDAWSMQLARFTPTWLYRKAGQHE